MDVFGKPGPGREKPRTTSGSKDSGGFTVSDNEDSPAYASTLSYSEFMTFTVTPVVTIEDAVGPITAICRGATPVAEHAETERTILEIRPRSPSDG